MYFWSPSVRCVGSANPCYSLTVGDSYYVALSAEAMCTNGGVSPDVASYESFPPAANNSVRVGIPDPCPEDISTDLTGGLFYGQNSGQTLIGSRADTINLVTHQEIIYGEYYNCWAINYVETNSAEAVASCGIVIQ